MYQIISLFVLCALALTEAKITTCNSPMGHVNRTDVVITNCQPDQEICILKHGTYAKIEFNFTINEPVKSVTAAVYGHIAGFLTIPFPIPDADVCAHEATTRIKCPLSVSSGPFQYSSSLYMESSLPEWNVELQWELKNEHNEKIACLIIPARVQA